MTLRHFIIFIEVCDSNGMTRAAERLHMTQPSVSQAISEMEAHYHVRLFERLNRRLFLSAAGEKLLTYARYIVNLNNQIEGVMQEFNTGCHLRVGASLTIGETIFVEIIKALKASYPHNKLLSVVRNTAFLEEMLLEDKLDMALVEGEVKSDYLQKIAFMDDELIFVASPSHELAAKRLISLTDIVSYDFLLREDGSGTRALFERNMALHNLKYNVVGIYSNAYALKLAVKADLGITVISKKSVCRELANGELIKLPVEKILFKRVFSIVYHKNKYISREMQEMIELCQNWQ